MNKKGFSLVEILVVTGIFSIIGLAITNLAYNQIQSTYFIEDKMEHLSLEKLAFLYLQDQQSCEQSLNGIVVANTPTAITEIKDSGGNGQIQSNGDFGNLAVGQMIIENNSVAAAPGGGIVDVTIPVTRKRSGGGTNVT